MIVNIEQYQGKLIISHVNKEGEIAFSKINIPPSQQFNWVYTNKQNADSKFISWDKKPVKKVPAKFLSSTRLQEFFLLANKKVDFLFENNPPKLYSCDIETEVTEEGFSSPEEAKNKITTIAWSHYPNVYVFGTKSLKASEMDEIEKNINKHLKPVNKEYKFFYKQYESEKNMLTDFLYNYARKAALITGWNFWKYDWQYIYNRCQRLGIDISWMSPTKQWYPYNVTTNGKRSRIMLPQHKLIIDYMEIYKKWDRSISPKDNNTLDFAAKAALGITKVRYKGTFQDLYEDFALHVFYNAIDTILVEEIHNKIKTMNTFLGLGNITKVEPMKAFSAVAMTQATIARYAYDRGWVFPKNDKNKVKEEYEGAFVFKPVPGMKEWIASYDYASLYPSIIRQFMMSIENFVTKDKNYQPNEHQVKCSSGAVFDFKEVPLLYELLTDYYGMRKTTKKIELQAEMEISELKKEIKKKMAGM
jgi:DNA polymerase elongation subunit (family B)